MNSMIKKHNLLRICNIFVRTRALALKLIKFYCPRQISFVHDVSEVLLRSVVIKAVSENILDKNVTICM